MYMKLLIKRFGSQLSSLPEHSVSEDPAELLQERDELRREVHRLKILLSEKEKVGSTTGQDKVGGIFLARVMGERSDRTDNATET